LDLIECRAALVELIAARTEARRIGTNLNQAVAAGHATGATIQAARQFAKDADRVVARLDDAAAVVVKKLP
jgi:hypothetical protein